MTVLWLEGAIQTQPSEAYDAFYLFLGGIFAVLVEAFRRYLFGRIESKVKRRRREDEIEFEREYGEPLEEEA